MAKGNKQEESSLHERGQEHHQAARSLLARAAVAVACALVLACIPACGGGGSDGSGGGSGQAQAAPASQGTAPTGAAFTQPDSILESPMDGSGDPCIDTSHTAQGYVCAQATSASRLKFQVACGDMAYNYDLPNDGTPITCPLNMGNGSYQFRVMQNTEGSSYVELFSTGAEVALASEFEPFLRPNLFCSYTAASKSVAKARDLTARAANQAEAVQAICDWLADNIKYDTAKAQELANSSGYVPDPDSTLATRDGICFDYASLAGAMLRSMGIPTKVMTGYVEPDNFYHAWIMVYVDGEWRTARFQVDRNTWSRVDVTFAASGATQYVGSGSGYTDRYTY